MLLMWEVSFAVSRWCCPLSTLHPTPPQLTLPSVRPEFHHIERDGETVSGIITHVLASQV